MLNTSTPNNIQLFGVRLGFEMEQMAEKLKMGLDAHKSFAQVYEDGKMNKEIRGEMMQLDYVVVQKPREEIRARKTQSPFKMSKRNDFARIFIWMIMAQGRTPLNHISRVQKTLFYKGFQVRFTALTL